MRLILSIVCLTFVAAPSLSAKSFTIKSEYPSIQSAYTLKKAPVEGDFIKGTIDVKILNNQGIVTPYLEIKNIESYSEDTYGKIAMQEDGVLRIKFQAVVPASGKITIANISFPDSFNQHAEELEEWIPDVSTFRIEGIINGTEIQVSTSVSVNWGLSKKSAAALEFVKNVGEGRLTQMLLEFCKPGTWYVSTGDNGWNSVFYRDSCNHRLIFYVLPEEGLLRPNENDMNSVGFFEEFKKREALLGRNKTKTNKNGVDVQLIDNNPQTLMAVMKQRLQKLGNDTLDSNGPLLERYNNASATEKNKLVFINMLPDVWSIKKGGSSTTFFVGRQTKDSYDQAEITFPDTLEIGENNSVSVIGNIVGVEEGLSKSGVRMMYPKIAAKVIAIIDHADKKNGVVYFAELTSVRVYEKKTGK